MIVKSFDLYFFCVLIMRCHERPQFCASWWRQHANAELTIDGDRHWPEMVTRISIMFDTRARTHTPGVYSKSALNFAFICYPSLWNGHKIKQNQPVEVNIANYKLVSLWLRNGLVRKGLVTKRHDTVSESPACLSTNVNKFSC